MVNFWRWMHPSEGDPIDWITTGMDEIARSVDKIDADTRHAIGERFRSVFWRGCGESGCCAWHDGDDW